MTKQVDKVLREVVKQIEPPTEQVSVAEKEIKKFVKEFKEVLKRAKVKANVFVGGSFAKGTVVLKDVYDADIFIRFDKQYGDEDISSLLKGLLKKWRPKVVKGSREYFQIEANDFLILEIIPVMKVRWPEDSKNITDLSYSHVKYVKDHAKTKAVVEGIKLAKAFTQAHNVYGAESYIRGFSGYGLELLVYYYKGFEKFLRAVAKADDKLIIDIEKHYKNKNEVLMNMNSSKLISPIVVVDPTFKERNALAALSDETFEKFKKVCQSFLKSPSVKAFEKQKKDLYKIKANAIKNKWEFILLEAITEKQEGDIAGTKLLKFYKHFGEELVNYFEVKDLGFSYAGGQSAKFFYVVKPKDKLLISGPSVKDLKNVQKFKKKHKKTFVKSGMLYSEEKLKLSIVDFVKKWKVKNKDKIKDMSVTKLIKI